MACWRVDSTVVMRSSCTTRSARSSRLAFSVDSSLVPLWMNRFTDEPLPWSSAAPFSTKRVTVSASRPPM